MSEGDVKAADLARILSFARMVYAVKQNAARHASRPAETSSRASTRSSSSGTWE